MQIKTAIILAGGLGTRLQEAVPNIPKCMALVNGKPFIDFVIEHLLRQGISHCIFALGYQAKIIIEHVRLHYPNLSVQFSIEEKLLGTGGAIKQAAALTTDEHAIIVNGDTLFTANLHAAAVFHLQQKAACSLLLKPMQNYNRFGTVILNKSQQVQSFQEKKPTAKGFINAGVYLLHLPTFKSFSWPAVFSFEKDYLEKYNNNNTNTIYGLMQDEYFIDIGIPEDYARAQQELGITNSKPINKKTTTSYPFSERGLTLFLDRDGVINIEKFEDYIHTWDEFYFYDYAVEAIAGLSKIFEKIIIVTNQKGVGKGVTKVEDLNTIHANMTNAIEKAGGRIDAIFYCPDLDNDSPNRKPNAGMAYMAQQQLPTINFAKSIMVGNNISDLQFGRNAGMQTAFVRTTQPTLTLPQGLADYDVANLMAFYQLIAAAK